ncbi:uncharacterized protein PAC_16180 [Phialocephala subalpina]|uniref:Protein kinase domain-containing protein n=1 Tax=Phialocephala subalpina TaxID=576137 RepID=A0A1L7XML8_9HELO|nr:uncharacterized protein PAC_16180 [Phialocephala subalpina]
MEVASFVIGTSGLISVAQMCIKAAQIVDGMKTFREETATLFAVYQFEYVRFNLWITQVLRVPVSIDDLQNLSLKDAEIPAILTSESPVDLRLPLHNALNDVKRILMVVGDLLEKYGAKDKKPSVKARIAFRTRVYREGGKESLLALLTEFKNWNDRLEGIVESRLRSTLISNMQVHVLASASTVEQLQTIEVASSSLHPALSNEAAFRRNLLEIEAQSSTAWFNLRKPAEDVSPRRAPTTKDGDLKALGRLARSGTTSQVVLQEWKFGQLDWTDTQITEAEDRAGSLASILNLDKKPENLRCLDLVGWTTVDTQIAQSDTKRLDFCFLYKIPTFANETLEPLSLRAALLLENERDLPTLMEKFTIALVVAKSILAFHSNRWLHKAVCSSNVLFFKDKQSGRPVFEPYMSGFEFARPDTAKDKTLDAFGGTDFDIFSHPDLVQTIYSGNSIKPRYQRQYDIYGLGMTLLEIGCWKPMVKYVKMKPPGRSYHNMFVKVCNEAIPTRMGTLYRDVIMKCFEWKPDAEKVEAGFADTEEGKLERRTQIEDFMYSVVNILEGCHCHN